MIQINPLKSYIDGGVRAALTTPPSASLVFDLPGKAIWVKGVKLKGTDHTYTFNHDNYITLTNTPDKNNPESEDIKIGVNITTLKNVIDTTYNGGTLALLQEGLNTEERTWQAKILHSYINDVLPTTKNLQINGTNYAIYTTTNSLPQFFAPTSLGTTGQILACTSSGLSWIDQIQNTDYRVSQSSTTSNSDYRIILKQGANNNPETDFVRFSEYLTFNPYTKTLKINNIKVVTATDIYVGSTAGLVPSATSAQQNYYLRGDGAWVNIATEMAAANTWRPIKVGNTDALGSGTNTGTLSFIAGTGITLTWDATNKRIIITNSSPDVNHNTDETVRQVPKTDNVNRPLMMINGSTSAGEQINTSMFSTGIYANASTKMITANGFIKAGSDDSYVLLGGGNHKALSDFSMAHSHPYLPLAGGTMTGPIEFSYNNNGNCNVSRTSGFSMFYGNQENATSYGFPFRYSSVISFMTGYCGIQFANYGGNGDARLLFRNISDQNTWTNWYHILHSGNSSVTKSEQTITVTINGTSQSLTNSTYNFSGAFFTSGNYNTAEHDANNITSNGVWYYTSNGPTTSLGASTNDGALYSQAYNSNWVGQITQDYRNGNLFVRGKNNGTWQAWRGICWSDNYTQRFHYSNQSNSPTYLWATNSNGYSFLAARGSISVNYANSAGNADTVDDYHASSLWRSDGATWNPNANVSLNASANNQEWSFDIRRNGYTDCYWHVWDSSLSTMLKVNADNGKVYAPYNFVGALEGNASTASLLALNTSPASTVGTAVGSWSPVSSKVYVYRQRWTNSAAGSDTADLSIYLDGNLTANMCLDGYYYSLSGFKKGGSSDSYVLLGGGGHKAISDFATSGHTHSIYAANENYGGFTKSGRLPISGFYQSDESESGGNAPWSSWMHLINCQHSNTGNNYALQIAASFFNNNTFKIRVTDNNVNNAWRDIIHSGNIGSQTVANTYHLYINSANTWSTWYWSGQSGQPSWLWGSNDGTNMYVWNPSNFSVNYANSAGNADTVDDYHATSLSRNIYIGYTDDFCYDVILLWPRDSEGTHRIDGYFYNTGGGVCRYHCAEIHSWFSCWSIGSYEEALFINNVNNNDSNVFRLCTCNYNGQVWYCIRLNKIQAVSYFFQGTWDNINFTLITYYHTQQGIKNSEIYNSLSEKACQSSIFYGNIIAPNFYSSSDIRLKNNINNISKSIRSFNWKESGQKSYGLIAQEIENEYPELVSSNDNGYKSINYTSALCMLVAKLENGVDKLKEKVKQLEDKLSKYENTL